MDQETDDKEFSDEPTRKQPGGLFARISGHIRQHWARLTAITAVVLGLIAAIGHTLGGVAGMWEFYRLMQGEHGSSAQTSHRSVTEIPASTVAVASPITPVLSIMALPFANHTGDPQKTYIADGLTTSITSDLSRIRDAYVIPTTTAFAYKDKTASVQQVGRDAGVRFVLQGSVLSGDAIIRISVQLADTRSGAQIWTQTFDGELTNLFALQDQVTTAVVNTIGREMIVVAAREAETRISSPKAADLMLRARAQGLKQQSLRNSQQIEAWYRQVLALEPNNAVAMAALAASLTIQAHNFGSAMDPDTREKKFVEGRDLATKARELDPNNPDIYTAIFSYADDHDDYAGSRRAAETAFSLAPKSPGIRNNLALVFMQGGEPQRAIELLTQAIRLDPKHPDAVIFRNMGYAYFMLNDNDAAIEWALKAVEMNATLAGPYFTLAMAYALKGDDAKARAAVADLHRVQPNFTFSNLNARQPSRPAAFKQYLEKKLIPAWRKAGLPE